MRKPPAVGTHCTEQTYTSHTDVRNSYNDNYGRGRLEMVVWLANTLDYSGGGGDP